MISFLHVYRYVAWRPEYMCKGTHVCVWGGVHSCVQIYTWKKANHWILPLISLHLIRCSRIFHLKPEAADSGSLVS